MVVNFEEFKGKRVLITGSSSGIGAATAKMFAAQGSYVGVHYFHTKQGGEDTFEQVKALSDGCLLCADVRNEAQVEKLVSDFADKAGGIDILINNAGTLIERQPLETATFEYCHDIFATNSISVFLVTRLALPYLKKSKGNIVNIGSLAGHSGGGNGSGLYASAKAAVGTMTIAMAKEFAAYDIRVNSVMPGLIETRFHELFNTAQGRKKVAEMTPVKRNGTAEDVGNVILFLASDAAAFITGEYIAVNGGLLMRP